MKVKNIKNKIKIIIPIFALFAAIVVGASIAFYSDGAIFSNEFQLYYKEDSFTEDFPVPDPWSPCDESPKTAIATNHNDNPRYVRMKIDEYWRIKNSQTSDDDHTTTDLPLTWTDGDGTHKYAIINMQNEDDWILGDDGWYYYKVALNKEESTNSLLKSVTFNCDANLAAGTSYSADGKTSETIVSPYVDGKYHVFVTFQMSDENWDPEPMPTKTVARIERTQKVYDSIMSAHEKAIAGDIITLLVDTEEVVTNTKSVTLDLNDHTVIGSLTNTTSGNITIINGEINNPDGAAVTNNGTLTIGVNDYDQDTGVALIDENNVRLVGTTAGLYQTNDSYKFYFYDGYLEGDIGLVGGYDGSPMYHSVADSKDVYFYPFVNHMESGNRSYQHVNLKSADRTVSKTSVHGDIYYYNLQDNINVSAVTGYKIYVVRDFDAGYPISVNAGENITFDIVGYTVALNNAITNEGTFTIIDSQSTINNETGDTVYAGLVPIQRTIQNTGTLVLDRVKVENSSNTNDAISTVGTLKMTGATISSKGHVLQAQSGAIYDLDSHSYITTTTSRSTIYNETNDFVWNTKGTVLNTSGGRALENRENVGAKATIKDGVFRRSDGYNAIYVGVRNRENGGDLIVDGGVVYGVSGGNVVLNGGMISGNDEVVYNADLTVNGGVIRSSGRAVSQSKLTMNDGSIEANGSGNVYGIWMPIEGSVINGGSINAVSTDGTGYGIYLRSTDQVININHGTIHGSTFGIYNDGSGSNLSVTIGADDGHIDNSSPLISGGDYGLYNGEAYKFFDGTISGNIASHQEGSIQAIPDGAVYKTVSSADYMYNTYLIPAENYLRVGGTEYNSLTAAYGAITGNSGTIEVIKNAEIETALPSSPADKEITFDLNGFELSYSQPLIISAGSTMNIVDGSSAGSGALHGSTSVNSTIHNSGTLNVQSGLIDNENIAITNIANATLNISGGTIKCKTACIDNNTVNSSREPSTVNLSGGLISITESNGSKQYGIRTYEGGRVNITGGQIRIEHNASAGVVVGAGYDGYYGESVVIDAGDGNTAIYINTPGASEVRGTFSRGVVLRSGTVEVYGQNTLSGLNGSQGISMTGGKVIAKNTGTNENTGSVMGVYADHSVSMTGGEIIVEGKAGTVTGIDSWNGTTISGGKVEATSASGAGYGVTQDRGSTTITGGEIHGSTYGTYNLDSLTIGANDGTVHTDSPEIIGDEYAIYGGTAYYYDGVLRGEKAYQENVIEAIPDGMTYNIVETVDYKENCTLKDADYYLEVNGTKYNSLAKAYDAITGDSGTIKVIASTTIDSVLPSSPSGKTITFDLNNHQLNYTQSLRISSTAVLNIVDNSTEKNGRLNNTTSNATIYNSGTLNIISGTIDSASTTIINDYGVNMSMTGGAVKCVNLCIQQGEKNISGGLIEVKNTSSDVRQVIFEGGNATITGGQIRAVRSADNMNTGDIIGFNDMSTTINVADTSQPIIQIDASSSYAKAFNNGGATFKSGKISVSGKTVDGLGMSGWNGNCSHTVENIIFEVNGVNETHWNNSCTLNMSGGNISVHSDNGPAYGIDLYANSASVTGGVINVVSDNGDAYGDYQRYSGITTLDGGTISTTAPNGIGAGLYANNSGNSIQTTFNVKSGTLFGSTYGIYSLAASDREHSIFNIGTDDNSIAASPTITGGAYGIYNGQIYFYDGVLKGIIDGYNDVGFIKAIPATAAIAAGSETIGGETYNTKYLVAAHPVAKIVGGSEYNRLDLAIDQASSNDTIELLEDNYILYTLTIPAEKDITIDTKGFRIVAGNTITNNGKVSFVNSGATVPEFYFAEISPYFFINAADAELSISNISFRANKIIDNSGTLTLSKVSMNAATTAVNNSGNTTISNNSNIAAGTYAFYGSAGESSISDTTISHSYIYNTAGKLTINNVTASTDNSASAKSYIVSNGAGGEMTITSLTATLSASDGSNYVVYNAGTMSLKDSSLTHNFTGGGGSRTSFYNDGGNTDSTNTNYVVSHSGDSYSAYSYGVQNTTGSFSIHSGSITSNSGVRAYGINNTSGTITLGDAEPSTSPNYGTANADVSTKDPSILAVGVDNGTAIANDSGIVNFYDGIIKGSHVSTNKAVNSTEHLYETRTEYTDGNGYKYRILEFMGN